MSQFGGETIQLSFGDASNAVTSHLSNLQGLACTTSEDPYASSSDEMVPLCDPYITHAIQNDTYVPRVLFVDGRNCFEPHFSAEPSAAVARSDANDASNHSGLNSAATGAWNGSVEIHHRNTRGKPIVELPSSSFNSNSFDEQNIYAANHFTNDSWNQLDSSQQHAYSEFQNVASVLSNTNSQSSRYNASRYSHVSSQFVFSKSITGGRVMNWDDEEEEEEEEEYEREYEDETAKQRRTQMEREKRIKEEEQMDQQLHHAWDTFVGIDTVDKNKSSSSTKSQEQGDTSAAPSDVDGESSRKRKTALDALQWRNYLMPPHPSFFSFSAPLPFDIHLNTNAASSQSPSPQNTQSILYSFQSGKHPAIAAFSSNDMNEGMTSQWRDEVLSDSIRKWMEDCDSVKGFQICVDADQDFFAGLASSVLEELGDECRSAGKFSILVGDGDSFRSASDGASDLQSNGKQTYWRSENKAVQVFRSGLNRGLTLHGLSENSDLVLPLSLTKCWKALHKNDESRNMFEASAAGAMALESVTLPYRLVKRNGGQSSLSSDNRMRSKIGIGSGYFQGSSKGEEDAYPTADKLTYHEFLSSMKPSNRHTLTELSGLVRPISPAEVHKSLLQGTSIERRQMEEDRNRNRNSFYRRSRGRHIDPGLWMEDEGPNGGILSSLSPVAESNSSRGLHQHFALASSMRPLPSRLGDVVSTYTTSMMEGMAISYRPQSSVATVVGQSFDALTGHRSHSAGSYWSSILGPEAHVAQTVTMLGNTTRVHHHLQTTAIGLKNALSRKYAGYLTRDGMSGLAPEGEDCEDAMEACLTLRDVYEPASMMFDSDEEGIYFDDNTD